MANLPTERAIVIQQGRTYSQLVRWETTPFMVAGITAMTQAGIAAITTAIPHGLPDGWRVAVVGAKGMTELNANNNPPKATDFYEATVKGPSVIELNTISSASFRPYTSGGYLKWYTPRLLTGYTARMSIKDRVGGTVLLSLTTENGGISIDPTEKNIQLVIEAAATEAITWIEGVYDLEMVSPLGEVVALFTGPVSVVAEITT